MIEVTDLRKRYGVVEAVKGVSFSLGAEQVLGFLGPNGAGKTTIMKILTGYHFPTAGTAKVDGISVEEDPVEVKKRIGYLPEAVPLYGDLTVREYLSFMARARLLSREEGRRAVEAGIESCGLAGMAYRRIDTLSKGYRQRVGLAQAIIHDPPILILDEPTTGLDPNQIIEIRSLIKELGKRKTVLLSTHILQEVEAVATQVLIIHEGRIAAQGRPDEIAASLKGGDTWDLLLKGAGAEAVKEKLDKFALSAGFELSSLTAEDGGGGTVRAGFFLAGEGDAPRSAPGEQLFDWAVMEGLKLLEMNRRKFSLEDIFVKLTGDSAGEERL
ncbi:MAG: ATP-binding cassette domain-containing protein [Spirochaetaceae bacterium]|jgi:ABC-2 type transport system ATP-binding protein|nr:ATP-binding cassette domain-containing protein [Spirochaetaceae bacterium]